MMMVSVKTQNMKATINPRDYLLKQQFGLIKGASRAQQHFIVLDL
jgi:hypothetical protein